MPASPRVWSIPASIVAVAVSCSGQEFKPELIPATSEPAMIAGPERISVATDNVRITKSCTLVIPPGTIIPDLDNNGVIHIEADDVEVQFEPGSVLRAVLPSAADDALAGTAIRVSNHNNIRIAGATIDGFRVGIWADHAPGLKIEDVSILRNYRSRLVSTPRAEDASDWLWPHKNDNHEWRSRYGTAVCIEDSSDVVLRAIKVRRSQNGIILDRVNSSRVVDCDASFLSGWGLAMWRSSGNLISRNSFDFCVRGYSDGVYNRGQDSAGMLVFEQCCDNSFIDNSATHCGDGFFCFAGREALGEDGPADGVSYAGRGCNRNTLMGNDFSYAAAHGIELTFSFDNWIINNKLIGNAICGLWAGYSQRTTIEGNRIERNGLPGAREGGGINIEHGAGNLVRANHFNGNTVGLWLWSDDDGELLKRPWALVNHRGSVDNHIRENEFADESIGIRLQQTENSTGEGNTFERVAQTIEGETLKEGPAPALPSPRLFAPEGQRQPTVGRSEIKDLGRAGILMTPWGPWERTSPMMRLSHPDASRHVFEIHGTASPVEIQVLEGIDLVDVDLSEAQPDVPRTLSVGLRGPGIARYRIHVRTDGIDEDITGTLVRCTWSARVFDWSVDPRSDVESWRELAKGSQAVAFPCDDLAWMNFQSKGPRDTVMLPEIRPRLPGPDRFGVIATAAINLPKGRWRVSTLSDDGVRVYFNDKPIIDNWTWHGPTRDQADFVQQAAGDVQIRIEYFEIDGHAVLEFELRPE